MQTQKVTLDFYNNNYKTVTVKQYDKDSRSVNITCTNNGAIYPLDLSKHECNVKMYTPDNRAIYNTIDINSDGTVTITFTDNMVHANGTGKLEIQVIEKSTKKILSSMILAVIIVGCVYDDDTVIASDEFSALNKAMLSIDDSVQKANESLNISTRVIDEVTEFENNIKSTEEARTEAENIRQSNETQRQSSYSENMKAENVRIQNENQRQINEDNRNIAENIRQENTEKIISNAENVISELEEAIDKCENAANEYALSAEQSASTAIAKASEASISAENASISATRANISATTAIQKASDASNYADNANSSASDANNYATTAINKASEASVSANIAIDNANNSSQSATLAESYAKGGTGVRDNEDVDNAKYYKEQAEQISKGLSGALLPMGTITFSQLATMSKQAGYMYNISDSFTTDSTFKEGAGYDYAAGTNVYYTADGYWDCIAGTNVIGVKGSSEVSYRQGNVNITKEDIGLGNVPNVATNDQQPTYSMASENENLTSGEKMSVAFGKIAKAISSFISHLSNKSNPHGVTKSDVGLGNVDNTSDNEKSVLSATKLSNTRKIGNASFDGTKDIALSDIGALATNGDSKDNTVSFTSSDSTTATAWTDVSVLSSNEKHSSIFNKISTMFKNIRYLYNMLGTTDISNIGDGTATGAISTLNGNLKNMEWKLITSASPTSENYQLAIPLDIAEICVVIRPDGNSYNEMIVSIPTTILST